MKGRTITYSTLFALAWLVFASFSHTPSYDEGAVVASAGLLWAAVACLFWDPLSGPWRIARLVLLMIFVQGFAHMGFSTVRDLSLPSIQFTPAPDVFSTSVEMTLVFCVALAAGIAIVLVVFRQERERALLPGGVSSGRGIFFGIACAATLMFAIKPGIIGTTIPLTLFGPALVVPLLVASGFERGQVQRAALAIVVAGHLLIVVITSMLGTLLGPVPLIFMSFLHARRRFPRRLAATGAVVFALFLVLNPAKHIFRNQLAKDNYRAGENQRYEDVSRALTVWGDSIDQAWSGKTDDSENVSTAFDRGNYIWTTGMVLSVIPSRQPYELGNTYADVFDIMIPRFLYPDKPTSASYYKTRWMVRLGAMTWESSKHLAIGVPMVAEAYWNFGWLGVVFVPLCVGVLIGGVILLAPRTTTANTVYAVLCANAMMSLYDMLMWFIPSLITLSVSAVVLRLYVRPEPQPETQPETTEGSGASALQSA